MLEKQIAPFWLRPVSQPTDLMEQVEQMSQSAWLALDEADRNRICEGLYGLHPPCRTQLESSERARKRRRQERKHQ